MLSFFLKGFAGNFLFSLKSQWLTESTSFAFLKKKKHLYNSDFLFIYYASSCQFAHRENERNYLDCIFKIPNITITTAVNANIQ
ncbi:hypothetical protein BpHYR1_031872 [Brachionus plicatilis]|uniref:Uncharacterized protein n=1 Tax=Brachionus plicatilis TaxID=10195 RepID=A0A3M7QVF9_BRAPC|nr:hypothetical protein BpHYR1_031872 [Brachionus plicatilis]